MVTSRSERDELQMQLPESGPTSWIPVSEVVEMLKVSRQRVYQLLQAGAIAGRQVGRTWLISRRSVESRVALLGLEGEAANANR